jgi:hypothetical protein
MSVPTLKVMLETYAASVRASSLTVSRAGLVSMCDSRTETEHPGSHALICFYQTLLGDTPADLDDLSTNIIVSGFLRLLKAQVPRNDYLALAWDLREFLGYLYENSYCWIDLGAEIERTIGQTSAVA